MCVRERTLLEHRAKDNAPRFVCTNNVPLMIRNDFSNIKIDFQFYLFDTNN